MADLNLSLPKFILIGRKALAHNPEQVQEALRITPAAGTFVTCDIDAKLAMLVCPTVLGMKAPHAIVADFPFDIATIDDQGRLVPGELPKKEE